MRAGARAKLAHFGLWESFAAGGFGDDTPVRAQVVRDGIQALAAVLGIDPDPRDCVVIGDTSLDVQAAHLAGARALAVATGSYPFSELEASGADGVVNDLTNTTQVATILRG